MAVTMRLSRMGRHKRPFYRIVATDSRFPREGRFLELLGTYDPLGKEQKVTIQSDRIEYWLGQGAQVSDTVKSIFQKAGIFKKASNS